MIRWRFVSLPFASSASRGFERRMWDPIGHLTPSGSGAYRKSFALSRSFAMSGSGCSGESTNGVPSGQRPMIFATISSRSQPWAAAARSRYSFQTTTSIYSFR